MEERLSDIERYNTFIENYESWVEQCDNYERFLSLMETYETDLEIYILRKQVYDQKLEERTAERAISLREYNNEIEKADISFNEARVKYNEDTKKRRKEVEDYNRALNSYKRSFGRLCFKKPPVEPLKRTLVPPIRSYIQQPELIPFDLKIPVPPIKPELVEKPTNLSQDVYYQRPNLFIDYGWMFGHYFTLKIATRGTCVRCHKKCKVEDNCTKQIIVKGVQLRDEECCYFLCNDCYPNYLDLKPQYVMETLRRNLPKYANSMS